MDTIITLEGARKYQDGKWAGNPNGTPYREGKCAAEVYRGFLFEQCSRNNGHGTNGLYCRQHAKKPA